ncbi:hypothetical protein HF847_04950 [Clostridium cochlearium]|nr:hypothetical protein [Clostridium cochlearium]
MEVWMKNLQKYFSGEVKLFEQTYSITYPCVLKRGRKRIRARIDLDHKIIYDLKGQIIKKCN